MRNLKGYYMRKALSGPAQEYVAYETDVSGTHAAGVLFRTWAVRSGSRSQHVITLHLNPDEALDLATELTAQAKAAKRRRGKAKT